MVYPDAEVLLEAYQNGELSLGEYLILKEVLLQGVDSTNAHLLDHIPNLLHYLTDSASLRTGLEEEQAQAFTENVSRRTQGRFRHRYYQSLEKQSGNRYQSSVVLNGPRQFHLDLQIEKDLNSRERLTRRSLAYSSPVGAVRKLQVGNYSRRLGLGTVAGYRGRLLSTSDHLDGESLLYPDYGGSNGLLVRLQPAQRVSSEMLISINRDVNHRFFSLAGTMNWHRGGFEAGLLSGLNRLQSRLTDERVHDIKLGLIVRQNYRHGYAAVETSSQLGHRRGFGAVVVEGRHRFRRAEVRYASWIYGDDFLDLASGSKAGSVARTDSLPAVGLSFSSRRTGAEGGLLRSMLDMSSHIRTVNALVFSSFDKGTRDLQFLTALIYRFDKHLQVRLDYVQKTKTRLGGSGKTERTDRRTRIEINYAGKNLLLRGYLGYDTETDANDDLAAFMRARLTTDKSGEFEVWSNLSRWNIETRSIAYWYVFFRHSLEFRNGVHTGFKVSHRYSRAATDKHLTTVTLELDIVI